MTTLELAEQLLLLDPNLEVVYLEGKTLGGEEISTHIDDQIDITITRLTTFSKFPGKVVLQ